MRLVLLQSAACLTAGALAFLLPKYVDVSQWLMRGWYAEIWIQATLTLYVAYEVYRASLLALVQSDGRESTSRSKYAFHLIGVGLVFAGVIASAVKAEWRVLADQTNLVGSSLSFYLDRTYRNITEGYFYYDSLHPTAMGLDNRPPLYSFVISVFHDVFGVNAYHGFHVNLLVACGLGMVFYHVGRQTLGHKRYGLLALLMLAGWPIVLQVIRSGGFEAINLFFLTVFYWQAYAFIKNPAEQRLELLFYLVLAAAMCRYESIVLIVPALILGISTWNKLGWTTTSPRLLLLPFGFVPLSWQRHLTTSINPGDTPDGGPFGIRYFLPNLQHLSEFLFDPRFKGFPSSPLLATLAFVGLAAFVWRGIKKDLSKRETGMAMVMGLSTLGILVVQCCFYMGDVRQVFQQRFVVSYIPGIIVMAVYGFRWFESELQGSAAKLWIIWLLWSGALGLSLNSLRQADIAYQGRWLTLYREYKASLDYLLSYPRQNTLFISDRPGMFVVHQYGAISFDTANGKIDDLSSDLRRKLYQSILVEQRIFYDSKKDPEPHFKLDQSLKLEPVFELQNDASYYMRISKLVLVPEVKPPIDTPPPKDKGRKKDKSGKPKSPRPPKAETSKKEP